MYAISWFHRDSAYEDQGCRVIRAAAEGGALTRVGESTRRELRVWRLEMSAEEMAIIQQIRLLATNLVGSATQVREAEEREERTNRVWMRLEKP